MTAEEIIRRAPLERWTPERVAAAANQLPFDEKLKFLAFMRRGGWMQPGQPNLARRVCFN